VIKPLTDQFYSPATAKHEAGREREPARSTTPPRRAATPPPSRPVVQERPVPRPKVRPEPAPPREKKTPRFSDAPKQSQEINGFERAVRYIGEHGSVDLAAVVDDEGLVMANFVRGQFDAERWAPLSLVFLQNNEQVLRKGQLETPEKLDIILKEKRVIVARDGSFSLMVISERQSDDVLSIRINQGLEMISRYVAERYGDRLHKNLERVNVSGA
jgi:predicted regulator of Ras-like GTPase activity (Roadblock/LC7/MglB family)